MKKFVMAVLCLLVCSAVALGQERKAELFAGYSYTNEDISPQLKPLGLNRLNAHGWDTSFAYRATKIFAIKADFAGAYSGLNTQGVNIGNLHMHTFLFGPQLRVPGEGRFSPFVHALFGVAHGTAKPSGTVVAALGGAGFDFSDNAFAMKVGGGLDVRLSEKIAWRSELGLLHTRFNFKSLGDDNNTQNHLRMSTGVLFTF